MTRRGFFSSSDPEEVYADHFALNLLMPEREFKRHYRREKNPALLGVIFDVPPEYVQKRIESLQLDRKWWRRG